MTEDPGGTTAPSPAPAAHGRHRRAEPPSRRPVAAIVLAVLCIPPAVAAIIFLVRTPASSPPPPSLLSGDRQTALTAARSSVRAILSYDYRTIDTDIATAKADTTGEFARQYASTAHQLLSEASQVKAIVQATVGSSGVVSTADGNVVVLLFVDQASVRKTPGHATPTTRIDQSRVRVTMTLVNGHWLVSDLAAL